MSAFSMTLCKSLWIHLPELPVDGGAPFHVPGTPEGLLITKEEIPESVLKSTDLNDPGAQFVSELGESDLNSWGVIVNSFDEVEGEYATLFEKFYRNGARAWLVGPLCLFSSEGSNNDDECLRWLDEQSPGSVVYVSFGTQAHVANEQLDEAAHGLAESGFAVLWVVRSETWAPPAGLLTRPDLKIVKWAPQREVLRHAATGGFVSHCGWNSVMEAASAGVPMLTWPMIAEQSLNAKHVVDELSIGLRLGSSGEIARREKVREGVRELMGRNTVRERAAELGEKARRAVEEGGASRRRLVELVEELRKCRREREGDIITNERVDSLKLEFHEGVQGA